jgi:phosphosulfolactate synthase
MPDFLDLPARPAKPRDRGITHVLDMGLTRQETEGLLEQAADHIDLVRLGYGTAYVTRGLERKLEVFRAFDMPVMLGGTLTELAWLEGRVDELRGWLDTLGIDRIEVSSGVVAIPPEAKLELIATLSRDRVVYAEVGEKDPDALLAPYRWVELITDALSAGATQVVCEGRGSGDAGIYRRDGEPRTGLVDEICHAIDPAKLIFEAPHRAQQAWLIKAIGPDVNLGNIPPREVIPLETLRLGLRGDTLKEVLLGDAEPATP